MTGCVVRTARTTPGPPLVRSLDVQTDAPALTPRASFTLLFERHHPRVHGYVARRIAPAEVEDVVNDVFLTAWRRFHDLPDEEHLVGWLLQTARRTLSTRRRGAQRWQRLAQRAASAVTPDPADGVAEGVAEREVLRDALQRLPDDDRELLMLVRWDGLTLREAGEVLGVPEGTVSSRMHRARGRLRDLLAETEAGGTHVAR